jgi:hypothetical protein
MVADCVYGSKKYSEAGVYIDTFGPEVCALIEGIEIVF